MNKGIALFALAGLASVASADLVFTEAYTGISGADGTEDWVEITNTGNSAIDLGGLLYEDNSANDDFGAFTGLTGDAATLSSMVVGAGESVIVLVGVNAGDEAAAIADFNALWGYTGQIQAVDGGGLSGNGDHVNLFDSSTSTLLASQITAGALSGAFDEVNSVGFSIDFVDAGPFGTISQLGVNGAYESGLIEDVDDGDRTLIASPGLVPAPSAFALLGLGGLVAGRRRR